MPNPNDDAELALRKLGECARDDWKKRQPSVVKLIEGAKEAMRADRARQLAAKPALTAPTPAKAPKAPAPKPPQPER
jgi:hypothetical protein